MPLGKFWFIDPKGNQQAGDGLDGVMTAMARGELLPDSMFYDPAQGAWRKASEVPALASVLGGPTDIPKPPPIPDYFRNPPKERVEEPGYLKGLTLLLLAAAVVPSVMANRDASTSLPVVVLSATVAVLLITAIIGFPILLLARPRRRWLMWCSVAGFVLLAMGARAAKLIPDDTGGAGVSPPPVTPPPGQGGPPGSGNSAAPGRGFTPS